MLLDAMETQRDRICLKLLYFCALRVGEVSNLRVKNILISLGKILIENPKDTTAPNYVLMRAKTIPSTEKEKRILESLARRPRHGLKAVTLSYDLGIRLKEIRAILEKHVQLRNVRTYKQRREDYALIPPEFLDELIAFIRGKDPEEFVIVSTNEGGSERVTSKKHQMTTTGIQRLIKRCAKKAGLAMVERVSPHSLRKSYATHILEAGYDSRIVQRILRHKKLETTYIYTAIADPWAAQTVSTFERKFNTSNYTPHHNNLYISQAHPKS